MRSIGKDIYLDTLERIDCKKLWADFEFDFNNPCEELNLGHSVEKADTWFDDIQQQGGSNIRLGSISAHPLRLTIKVIWTTG